MSPRVSSLPHLHVSLVSIEDVLLSLCSPFFFLFSRLLRFIDVLFEGRRVFKVSACVFFFVLECVGEKLKNSVGSWIDFLFDFDFFEKSHTVHQERTQ